MHGLSIFCHSWQIADHTHIFSLPLPHKLWLHMGKHSSLQECSKPQPTPRTHSRDSPTEFPPMVSRWTVLLAVSSGGPVVVCLSSTSSVLLLVYFRNCHHPLAFNSVQFLLVSFVRAVNSYLEVRGGEQVAWVVRPLALLSLCLYLNLASEHLTLESKVFLCIFVIKLLWMKSFGVKIHFLFIRCLAMIREVHAEFNKLLP